MLWVARYWQRHRNSPKVSPYSITIQQQLSFPHVLTQSDSTRDPRVGLPGYSACAFCSLTVSAAHSTAVGSKTTIATRLQGDRWAYVGVLFYWQKCWTQEINFRHKNAGKGKIIFSEHRRDLNAAFCGCRLSGPFVLETFGWQVHRLSTQLIRDSKTRTRKCGAFVRFAKCSESSGSQTAFVPV